MAFTLLFARRRHAPELRGLEGGDRFHILGLPTATFVAAAREKGLDAVLGEYVAFKEAVLAAGEGATSLELKDVTPVRLLHNDFAQQVIAAQQGGATSDELRVLLGHPRRPGPWARRRRLSRAGAVRACVGRGAACAAGTWTRSRGASTGSGSAGATWVGC